VAVIIPSETIPVAVTPGCFIGMGETGKKEYFFFLTDFGLGDSDS
jgi:hypothetical protein